MRSKQTVLALFGEQFDDANRKKKIKENAFFIMSKTHKVKQNQPYRHLSDLIRDLHVTDRVKQSKEGEDNFNNFCTIILVLESKGRLLSTCHLYYLTYRKMPLIPTPPPPVISPLVTDPSACKI